MPDVLQLIAVHFHHFINTLIFFWHFSLKFHQCGRLLDLCIYLVSENSLVVACVCSLSLQLVDGRHQQACMSQTQDFLVVEAK